MWSKAVVLFNSTATTTKKLTAKLKLLSLTESLQSELQWMIKLLKSVHLVSWHWNLKSWFFFVWVFFFLFVYLLLLFLLCFFAFKAVKFCSCWTKDKKQGQRIGAGVKYKAHCKYQVKEAELLAWFQTSESALSTEFSWRILQMETECNDLIILSHVRQSAHSSSPKLQNSG